MDLYVLAALFLAGIGVVYWAYRRGKRDERLAAAERTAGVKDVQIAAEHNRPGRDDISRRL